MHHHYSRLPCGLAALVAGGNRDSSPEKEKETLLDYPNLPILKPLQGRNNYFLACGGRSLFNTPILKKGGLFILPCFEIRVTST